MNVELSFGFGRSSGCTIKKTVLSRNCVDYIALWYEHRVIVRQRAVVVVEKHVMVVVAVGSGGGAGGGDTTQYYAKSGIGFDARYFVNRAHASESVGHQTGGAKRRPLSRGSQTGFCGLEHIRWRPTIS